MAVGRQIDNSLSLRIRKFRTRSCPARASEGQKESHNDRTILAEDDFGRSDLQVKKRSRKGTEVVQEIKATRWQ